MRGLSLKALVRESSPKVTRGSRSPLNKGNGSHPRASNGRNGTRAPEVGQTWAQKVQGLRRFKWKTSKTSTEKVEKL